MFEKEVKVIKKTLHFTIQRPKSQQDFKKYKMSQMEQKSADKVSRIICMALKKERYFRFQTTVDTLQCGKFIFF